jgi:hypothetical protein
MARRAFRKSFVGSRGISASFSKEPLAAGGKKKDKPMKNKNILLIMMPYWDPLIPPQGISHLKNFLQHHGYRVVTKDANTEDIFKRSYNAYFNILKKYVPREKKGNFYNMGHDVMRNHMIAHINNNDEKKYKDLVRELVYHSFYTEFSEEQIVEFDNVLVEFYAELEKYAVRLLEEIKPEVLGISVLRDTIGPSLFMFNIAKKINPGIKTVMGGSVFADVLFVDTPNFESFLARTPYIDKIIIGEGQNLFLKLLCNELPESQKVFTLKDIDGETLGYSPLNTPDMSDFNVREDYPYLAAQSSSSCPFECSFCNVKTFWGEYRKKDPQQTVDEMTALFVKYGSQLFFMNDSLLNYTASDLAHEVIKSNTTLYWDGYLRVDQAACDSENTFLWRRGGLYRVRLGVETGSQKVLDLMDKKITLDMIRSTLHSLANAGIKTTTYWVIGHPGETEEDFLQTLDFLEELKNYIYEAECNMFLYSYSGQGKTAEWEDKRKLLYPASAEDMLILQTWIVNAEPLREEMIRRVCRFIEHCNNLGIPNPYSLYDIYKADERWQKLHKNAVPNLVDFKEKNSYVDDTGKVEEFMLMQNTMEDDGDFGF